MPSSCSTSETVPGISSLRHTELQQQVEAEQARLERVEIRLRQIEQEGSLPRYEVLVKRVEPRVVAGIGDTISGFGDIGSLVRELQGFLRGRGVLPGAAAPCLAVCYDAE